tara:strand:+ start:6448 stop:7650 length:1203 start_codon:yes stop_codon:yes gene_type:complete
MATAHMNVKGRTSLDGSGWAAGLRKMETSTKAAGSRMRSSMAGAIGGVFAIGFLKSATMRMVQHADAIDKMAKRMESTTDIAQRFDFAASQNGASVGDIEKAFTKTAASMEGARQGLQTQIKAFAAFGITLQMIKNSTPEQIFIKIAEAVERAGGALDRAKSLQDIMGRGGRQLTPAFVSGFSKTVASAPTPIDAETIKNLADFNDQLDRLSREVLPVAADAVSGMADLFEMLITGSGGNNISLGERAGNIFKNSGAALNAAIDYIAGPGMTSANNPDTLSLGRWSGADVTGNEWSDLNEQFGKPIPRLRNPFTEKNRQDYTSGIFGFNTNPMIGPQMPQAAAAAAGTGGFMRPNLALNSLQRIGAAVSQSADPIAVEKDNNKLLNKIANNTKTIAQNSE